MSEEEATELPLDTSIGEAGAHATDAFGLLADETRLAILLALWEEYDPHASENVVLFSDLFDRVEYDDPGSFSYHLQQLTGHFIRQYPDGGGYELRVPALRFLHAVIAGAGVEEPRIERTEIDRACTFCGAPTTIEYREGLVVHRCTECEGVSTGGSEPGFLSAVPFDPAGLTDRDPDEIRAASRVAAWRQTQFMFDGLCPACSSPVDSWLDICSEHDSEGICAQCARQFQVLARFECRTCKNHNASSPQALVLFLPAVVAFYEDHGVSTRFRADDIESVQRIFDLMEGHEVAVLDGNPARVRVTVSAGSEELHVTFGDSVDVLGFDEHSATH